MKKRLISIICIMIFGFSFIGCKNNEKIKGYSNKWAIDFSYYDDVPDDFFITMVTLRLYKDGTYSFGYHFQGGPFSFGTYEIKNKKLILNYPNEIREESTTHSYLLNKIFPEKQQQVLTYDSKYKTIYYCGCMKNDNVVFVDIKNPSPCNEIYEYEGYEVIKLKSYYAYTTETVMLRTEPSKDSELGKFSYCISRNPYFVHKLNYTSDKDENISFLIAGKVFLVNYKTTWEEELYGIKAPWFYITIWPEEDEYGQSFWIWGGYIEEYPEKDEVEKIRKIFINEALRLNVIKSLENIEN